MSALTGSLGLLRDEAAVLTERDEVAHRSGRTDRGAALSPGVGPKSAQRIAYHLLQYDKTGRRGSRSR